MTHDARSHGRLLADVPARDEITAQQRTAITAGDDHVFVAGGPGTGKTYVLIERCRHLRAADVPAARILMLTFSRRSAAQLRRRLVAAGFAQGEIEVRTLGAFAARVARAGPAPSLTSRSWGGASRQIVFDAAIEDASGSTFGRAVRASRAFRSEVAAILAALHRAAGALQVALPPDASIRLRAIFDIARSCAQKRLRLGRFEEADIIAHAVAKLADVHSPEARWLSGRYAHVLVDEFTDIDRVGLELLSCMGATVFGVGDPALTIDHLRGQNGDIVAKACARLQMRQLSLEINWRSTPEICKFAAQTPILQIPPLQSALGAGAPIEVLRFRAIDDEVYSLADRIQKELQAGHAADRIGVLLRLFAPVGPLLVAELRRRCIAVATTSEDALPADMRLRTLRAALGVLDSPTDPVRWHRLLAAQVLGFDVLRTRFVDATRLRLDASLSAELGLLRAGAADPHDGLDVAGALLAAHEPWLAGDFDGAVCQIVRRLRLTSVIFDAESPAMARTAASRLGLICAGLAAAQRSAACIGVPARPGDLFARFDELVAEIARDHAQPESWNPGVRVLPVNAARGLVFERVFLADIVEGRFPLAARPSTLLTTRDQTILADWGCEVSDVRELVEATFWFSAVTRCQRQITLSYAEHDLAGEVQRASRFLPPELLPIHTTVVDRVQDQDHVRATRAATDVSPAVYDRALGVGDGELWLRCPRRLFYKRFVRLPEDQSANLLLGLILHAVLERFHTRNTNMCTTSDVGEWTAELLALRNSLWDADAFDSPVVARAAQVTADLVLRSYATTLAAHIQASGAFEVESCEASVELRVGEHVLHGRIDRIDRFPDGSKRIVDYKLGHARQQTVTQAAQKMLASWHLADIAGTARVPLERRVPRELPLQLALYASAITNTLTVQYVYLGGHAVVAKRDGVTIESEAFGTELRAIAAAALTEIRDGLLSPLARHRLDAFPVTTDAQLCLHCSYRGICRGADDPDA